MMPEISLNILDIAENSVRAGAKLVHIQIEADTMMDYLFVAILDDGCGMTPEQNAQAADPFFTTRTTRSVGLGLSFFKFAAEASGGSFSIESKLGVGTQVNAGFTLSHIDRMPLGDISSTIHTLILNSPQTDFIYEYRLNGNGFVLDTREFKAILGDIPFSTPEISAFIMEYLTVNKKETDGGMIC